jgi:hypothetical protein
MRPTSRRRYTRNRDDRLGHILKATASRGVAEVSEELSETLGQLLVSRLSLRMVVFDHKPERLIKWIDC